MLIVKFLDLLIICSIRLCSLKYYYIVILLFLEKGKDSLVLCNFLPLPVLLFLRTLENISFNYLKYTKQHICVYIYKVFLTNQHEFGLFCH
jgi:hypothetical protein